MSKESEAGEEGVHPVRSMKKASVPETERERRAAARSAGISRSLLRVHIFAS